MKHLPTVVDELNAMINKMQANYALSSWDEFVEALQVPGDLAPALMTQRTELLRLVQPRAMTAEEVAILYKLIIGLIETNSELQSHAQQVARQVHIWTDAFKQLRTVGHRIEHFANFRHTDDDALANG